MKRETLRCFPRFDYIWNSSNKRRTGTAALIRGRRLLTFLLKMRRLFEGGAYSRAALIRTNTVYTIKSMSYIDRHLCYGEKVGPEPNKPVVKSLAVLGKL